MSIFFELELVKSEEFLCSATVFIQFLSGDHIAAVRSSSPKTPPQAVVSMRIFELNHLINGMIFFFSKKHLEDHPLDILKKDNFPNKS